MQLAVLVICLWQYMCLARACLRRCAEKNKIMCLLQRSIRWEGVYLIDVLGHGNWALDAEQAAYTAIDVTPGIL